MVCGASFLPVALALAAAMLFSLGIQFSRLGLRHTDARSAALIQIGTAAGVYGLSSPFFALLLGRFLFAESEIDTRAMVAVALVVPGVILVTL